MLRVWGRQAAELPFVQETQMGSFAVAVKGRVSQKLQVGREISGTKFSARSCRRGKHLFTKSLNKLVLPADTHFVTDFIYPCSCSHMPQAPGVVRPSAVARITGVTQRTRHQLPSPFLMRQASFWVDLLFPLGSISGRREVCCSRARLMPVSINFRPGCCHHLLSWQAEEDRSGGCDIAAILVSPS